jgi:hypothetical protein
MVVELISVNSKTYKLEISFKICFGDLMNQVYPPTKLATSDNYGSTFQATRLTILKSKLTLTIKPQIFAFA